MLSLSGKKDQSRRKARWGNFPGQPGFLGKGGSIDLEKTTCVPETKAAISFPFSHMTDFLKNPRKGILKNLYCILDQV